MRSRKAMGFGLLVAAAAMMVMAIAATTASATEVKPENKAFTAKLQAGKESRFIPKNAYNKTYVACDEASAAFTVPDGKAQPEGMRQNTNKEGVGTYSQGQGSVSTQLESPKFETCELREFKGEVPTQEKGKGLGVAVTVTAGSGWTLAAWGFTAPTPDMLAIGIPKENTTIKFNAGLGECVITVGAGQQTVVMGEFTEGEPGVARFDGQVKYTVNSEVACLGLGPKSPAQYESSLNVTNAEGKKLEIL